MIHLFLLQIQNNTEKEYLSARNGAFFIIQNHHGILFQYDMVFIRTWGANIVGVGKYC
jgi:hypothetical protein